MATTSKNNSNATKVRIPCRISFANIFEAKSINGGDAKYSVSCLIPKTDKETLLAIHKAVEAAKEDGKTRKWGGKQHVIKEWFADYFIHTSDITFDFTKGNEMIIHNKHAEPWKVTVVDTGLNTQTGGRIKRVRDYVGDPECRASHSYRSVFWKAVNIS